VLNVRLTLLVLKTRQLDKLLAFFRGLGMEFTHEQHGNGPVHYSAKLDKTVLELYPLTADSDVPDVSTRLGFTVENLNAIVQALVQNGVLVITSPKQTVWGYRAVVQDPDGRSVELYQRQP
jgi:lactoylglutathione lyase